MTETVAEVLTCSGCGDVVTELKESDEGLLRGPCCHELPQPWRLNPENGLYTNNSEYRMPGMPDPDEEEENANACRNCGSETYEVVWCNQTCEAEDGQIYVETADIHHVECDECGTRSDIQWEWV